MKTSSDFKDKLMEAAVVVPLYQNSNGNIIIVLVRRTKGGLHSGQLAFPGGKKNSHDKTMLETAIRETEEEIGISSNGVKVLENLPIENVPATGFRIYPFLAQIVPPEKWNHQEDEIAEILEVKIQDLTRPNIHVKDYHTLKGWPESKLISFYRIGQYRLWGASYRILHPLIPRLLAGEWKI